MPARSWSKYRSELRGLGLQLNLTISKPWTNISSPQGHVHDLNDGLDVQIMNTLNHRPVEGGVATSARRGQDERLVLGLLESVEQDGATSQRRLAADLGIAVGLVNAYLNRCIQKGAC